MKQRSRLIRALISRLRRVNIFPRLLFVFCVLLIGSTLFITLFNQGSYGRELETNVSRYLGVLVQNAAMKLGQERDSFEAFLLSVTQDETVITAAAQNERLLQAGVQADTAQAKRLDENTRRMEQTLRRAGRQMEGVKALALITEHTQYRMAAGPDSPPGAYVRDLDAFRAHELYTEAVAANGYPVWRDSTADTSRLFYESETDRLGIVGCVTLSCLLIHPVRREPLGVLVCCIYPQHFTNLLSEYSSQDGGNTFLVGDSGMVEGIAAGLDAPPFLRQRANLLRRVFAQHEGSLLLEADGRELLVSFSGDAGFPLHIVNLTYRDWALRQVKRMGRLNLLICCAVILVGSFGCYLAAASISRPINRLIRSMKRVGAGDFSAMYRAESHDEVGVLCSEFDRMVTDMQALIDRVYVSEIREKALALNEKTAQLEALQMQINPHFLYNTLDMIRWECMYENGAESPASDMIETFCTLLRMTIRMDKKKETVAESLLHASTYLDVVNFRHTRKIRLDTQLSFDPSAYLIPRLFLQPILENAVRHGFAIDSGAACVIRIAGSLTDDGRLILDVSDNGAGMTAEQLLHIRSHLAGDEITQESIGLRNVNQRCRLCYGEDFGLSIDSAPGEGTSVRLTIPAEPAPHDAQETPEGREPYV